MKLLRNLKVGKKLLMLVSLLLALTIALSGVGAYAVTTVTKGTEKMYNDVLLTNSILGHYRANNRAIETIMFQMMQKTSEDENVQLFTKMESLFKENNEFLNQLKQANWPQENKELIQQVSDNYPKFKQEIMQVLELGTQNKNGEAYQYYKDKVEVAKNKIVQLGAKLEANSNAYAEDINNTNKEQANQVYLLVIIGAVFAIILGLAFSFIITRMITYPIQLVKDAITKAEDGDFTSYIDYDAKDELGGMATIFNEMLQTLRAMLSQIGDASHQLAAYSIELSSSAEQTGLASEHIATSVQEIATGAEAQVRSLEESGSTLKGMAQNTQNIAENAKSVTEQAVQAEEKSVRGIEAIDKVSEQMNMINESIQGLSEVIQKLGARSGEIGLIVDTITGIATQTNLLALNAAIEAARVGEQGKGFAVVADEVRKLAEESSSSASQISTLVDAIRMETEAAVQSMQLTSTEVSNGLVTVHEAGESFHVVQQAVNAVTGQIQEVSDAVDYLASGTEQMLAMIEEINDKAVSSAGGTQNISAASEEQLATMEEITASSTILSSMADDLQTNISKFKV